ARYSCSPRSSSIRALTPRNVTARRRHPNRGRGRGASGSDTARSLPARGRRSSRPVHRKPRMFARALAALALVVGAGVFTATPARADHGPDVNFRFSFGFPVPIPVPVVEHRVYYETPTYYEEPVGSGRSRPSGMGAA